MFASHGFDVGLLQRARPDLAGEIIVDRGPMSQNPSRLMLDEILSMHEFQGGATAGLAAFAIEFPESARARRFAARFEVDIDRSARVAVDWQRADGADGRRL